LPRTNRFNEDQIKAKDIEKECHPTQCGSKPTRTATACDTSNEKAVVETLLKHADAIAEERSATPWTCRVNRKYCDGDAL
jgi:hypothetical protein